MNLSQFYEFFYPLLLLLSFVLIIKWIKSKESKWIGSMGEYRVRKAIALSNTVVEAVNNGFGITDLVR
jgi:hypothetical protein